jgi:hypothetical protein
MSRSMLDFYMPEARHRVLGRRRAWQWESRSATPSCHDGRNPLQVSKGQTAGRGAKTAKPFLRVRVLTKRRADEADGARSFWPVSPSSLSLSFLSLLSFGDVFLAFAPDSLSLELSVAIVQNNMSLGPRRVDGSAKVRWCDGADCAGRLSILSECLGHRS